MAEYIDKDKLLNAIECIDISDCTDIDDIFIEIERTIDEHPAADVAEVRHGKWLNSNGDYTDAVCSVCSELHDAISPPDRASKEWFELFCAVYKYCPNCGAKMDGKAGDDK